MKKITIYNIVFAVFIVLYLLCFVLNLCKVPYFGFIIVYWFQIFLYVMGVLVLTKGILFKLDSSYFAGISLLLVATVFLFRDIYILPFYYVLTPLFASLSIASIIVYCIFKNKLYLKLFLYSLIFVGLGCIGYAF